MEAERTSETSVYFNETTRPYIRESCHLHSLHHENLNLINTAEDKTQVWAVVPQENKTVSAVYLSTEKR
jgi:hypothetical protein